MKVYQLALLGIVVIVGLAFFKYQSTYGTIENVDVVVTDKERVTTGSGDSISSKYLIYTDGETFENTDNLFYGTFNSSDFYGRIQRNHRYRLTVCGWRVPWLSMYRNIVEMQEVSP